MPLSDPAPRRHLHTRDISLQGYQRADGLFDIEAEITDTKTYDFNTDDRIVATGTPLHHMRARITLNEDMLITRAEAVTEAGPYSICGGGALTFDLLEGLTIQAGFLKAANQRLGGAVGCTHLRELLQQMATVAFQTTFPVRARREKSGAVLAPRLLDTCYAYAADGPVVEKRYPAYFTGTPAS